MNSPPVSEVVTIGLTTATAEFLDDGEKCPPMEYQRLTELWVWNGSSVDGVILPKRGVIGLVSEQELIVARSFAERLLDAAKHVEDIGGFNCNWFGKVMAGMGPGRPSIQFMSRATSIIGIVPYADMLGYWQGDFGAWPDHVAEGDVRLYKVPDPERVISEVV